MNRTVSDSLWKQLLLLSLALVALYLPGRIYALPDNISITATSLSTRQSVILHLVNWTVLSSGTFGGSPLTYTNSAATNEMQFYIIRSP